MTLLYSSKRNTFNTVFAFRVHLRKSRSRKNVKGSSESQKLQENSDGTRSSSPVDTVTPLVVPLTTRTRFALVNRNEPPKWRKWKRKRQKDSIPYTFESTEAFAFPSKNPRTHDPETRSILEYIWSVARRYRFSRRNSWRPVDTPLGQVGPPIEIEISFPSRYMTFTSSLLARGSLYRSSFSFSSRLSLVSDETGFAPNFTVELYNPRCRRCALYAFSLCYVFLRPTVSVFLSSSPSVSLARNL